MYDYDYDDYMYQERRDNPTLYNKNLRNFKIAESDYERKLANPLKAVSETEKKFNSISKQLERENL